MAEKFVRFNQMLIITEFVITEFHCSIFLLEISEKSNVTQKCIYKLIKNTAGLSESRSSSSDEKLERKIVSSGKQKGIRER